MQSRATRLQGCPQGRGRSARRGLFGYHNHIQIRRQPGRNGRCLASLSRGVQRTSASAANELAHCSLHPISSDGIADFLTDCNSHSSRPALLHLLCAYHNKVAAMLRLATALYRKVVRPLAQALGLGERAIQSHRSATQTGKGGSITSSLKSRQGACDLGLVCAKAQRGLQWWPFGRGTHGSACDFYCVVGMYASRLNLSVLIRAPIDILGHRQCQVESDK